MSVSRRVLIVEDDSGVRDLIRTRLGGAGYETYTARDGQEGLARAFELRPSGIVLDINMPHMDGFSVLDAMRKDNGLKRIPVLVLTARHAADDVQHAIGLGAKDFLTKPFNEVQLLGRMARLMRTPIPPPAPEAQIDDTALLL